MARNNLPRPTRTDIHGIIPSIDENWFAQYAPMSEQEPQEQPGILERTWESAKAVGEGLTFLPGGIVDTVQDVVSGFDPTDKEEMAQRAQTQRELEAYHKKYAGKAFGGVTEAMSSWRGRWWIAFRRESCRCRWRGHGRFREDGL